MILLKGGTVISSSGAKRLDVLIEDEKIKCVDKHIVCDGAQVVDVTGKLLFPGFIDAHTHFDLEVSNTVTADDFASGSRGAVLGGTTTVIDFATQNKGESLNKALNNWHMKAVGKTSCDYAFHMAISDWNDNTRDELEAMLEQGVTSFKVYMTYPAMKLDDRALFEVLKAVKELGGIVGVHCENSGIIDALVDERRKANKLALSDYPSSRPDICEAEAVSRILKIAYVADAPIIIVHLSTELAYEEIVAARKRGQTVYVETCPQYLLLDDSKYNLDFSEGSKFVCAPPIRKKTDADCLWNALKHGKIQTISTDHCSFTTEQKSSGKDDFTKTPCGLPGVSLRGVLMYTYGVKMEKISLSQMCSLLCENPARLYGLYPRKGSIIENADADIVVYDPNGERIISEKDAYTDAGYTPYDGMWAAGKVERVYLRGNEVVRDSQILNENLGQYLSRNTGEL